MNATASNHDATIRDLRAEISNVAAGAEISAGAAEFMADNEAELLKPARDAAAAFAAGNAQCAELQKLIAERTRLAEEQPTRLADAEREYEARKAAYFRQERTDDAVLDALRKLKAAMDAPTSWPHLDEQIEKLRGSLRVAQKAAIVAAVNEAIKRTKGGYDEAARKIDQGPERLEKAANRLICYLHIRNTAELYVTVG
jgi:chromosome segregation ATPase